MAPVQERHGQIEKYINFFIGLSQPRPQFDATKHNLPRPTLPGGQDCNLRGKAVGQKLAACWFPSCLFPRTKFFLYFSYRIQFTGFARAHALTHQPPSFYFRMATSRALVVLHFFAALSASVGAPFAAMHYVHSQLDALNSCFSLPALLRIACVDAFFR